MGYEHGEGVKLNVMHAKSFTILQPTSKLFFDVASECIEQCDHLLYRTMARITMSEAHCLNDPIVMPEGHMTLCVQVC